MRVLLVVYDNQSFISWFPQGLGHIAAVLEQEGCSVEVYNQDQHHYPDAQLTEYLDQNRVDIVGVSVIGGYYQYRRLLGLSQAINRSRQRPFYILGGHGPVPDPRYFFEKTRYDALVMGEGENTIVELLRALSAKKDLSGVAGIAFPKEGKVVINAPRPLIPDIDRIPRPAYHLFPMTYYRLLRMPRAEPTDFVAPLLSGRGCLFTCNFCYRMDKGFRPRSAEAISEEIAFLKREHGITYIAFSDELLMSSQARTEELCRSFIGKRLGVRWCCNGRLNFAEPALLRLMKEAGCVFINYGIEAFDDQVLRNMKKALTTKQIVAGIEATLASGISPGFNIIFGNIGDSRETLRKGVDFLLRYDDGAQMRTIRPVTPYPGSPLFDHAVEKGLLKDCADFYENKHLNSDLLSVNFTELSDEEFHQALFDANRRLIENYHQHQARRTVSAARSLYIGRDASFRGFRQS
ncbi:MAG: B12-binding domain-containing radical SAM protein [Elusimicrobia bacterium]|nr:B12-binding domain-containing radical SAM protein [Elusimicrobiota bacterium]